MKKLVALLAVLSYVPFAHAAEGDWTHSGEFRLQYFNNQDADFSKNTPGNDQNWHQRTRIGTTVRAGEKVTFNLGLIHNADWGSNGDATPDHVSSTTANVEGTENLLTVQEANVTWQATDEMTWKFGRITHQIADGSVVGFNNWNNTPKAFDGIGFVYEFEPVRVAAFGVTGAKGTTANQFGRFYGVSVDAKTLPAWLKMANLHYIIVKRDEAQYTINGSTASSAPYQMGKQDTTRIGLTVGGDTAGVDYKLTYAIYEGDETAYGTTTESDIDTSMWDLEVGYSLPEMMNFRVYAGMHSDSGTKAGSSKNETYNGFHYNTYENAGLMDVVGWGNLTYQRLGISLAPQEDVTVGLEYLMFSKTEKTGSTYSATGATKTTVSDDDLGAEIDLVVTKKYTNNFSIQARYGQFAPGDAFATDDTYTQWYLESKLTF